MGPKRTHPNRSDKILRARIDKVGAAATRHERAIARATDVRAADVYKYTGSKYTLFDRDHVRAVINDPTALGWAKCPLDGVHYNVLIGYCKNDTMHKCNLERTYAWRIRKPFSQWRRHSVRRSRRRCAVTVCDCRVCTQQRLQPWTTDCEIQF